jgi:hypothetical protein
MNANRIPGLGPADSNKSVDRQAQREAAQRVEKVGEVDPDEQARQQRFQQIMQSDAEAEAEANESMALPSPFDLSGARQSSSSDFGMDEIPNSSYSQPPNLSPSSQESMSDEDLPQSDQFWQGTDLPDQPIGKPQFQEQTAKKGVPTTKKGGPDLSLLGPPGKPPAKKSDAKSTTPAPKKKTSTEETPTARYWTPDNESSSMHKNVSSTDGKKGSREKSLFSSDAQLEPAEMADSKKAPKPSPESFSPLLSKAEREASDRQKKQETKKKENIQIVSPSLPELPAIVQPAAIAATQAAATYLRPEIVPVFYQMIGSIIVMSTPPGISRTEFVLNNPAFANSKFFGATVELTKYSTAPDSFNIRLSGSNEAVAAFNQSIPNLTAAFQTGHFSFRIGRIDVEYATDRPVLRRKESKEDESGGQSNQDKRRQ